MRRKGDAYEQHGTDPSRHGSYSDGKSQPEANTRTEPAWARDGSYLVYRRLRQNVAAFNRFLAHGAASLTDVGQGARTLRRRIIRRGVTYGPAYSTKSPKGDRGLLFLCYQSSITDQFEFLWRQWSNATNTPRADAGIDPILGQAGDARPESRVTYFVQGAREAKVNIPERFIISTGGAYLFAPSISAIRDVLAV